MSTTRITLHPDDPYESVLLDMYNIHKKKAADYATEDDQFSNFHFVPQVLALDGYGVLEDITTMVARKLGRIVNLRGRSPKNESVQDSWLDLAVYAALGLAYLRSRE